MSVNTKEYIDKRELCELLGFSIGNVDNMMRNKRLTYYKIGKSIRFKMIEINDFIKKCKK